MLVKFTTKHASSGLVTLVTHNGFAVLVFLPFCCVNSLVFGMEDQNGLFNEGDDGKEEGRRESLPSSRLPIFPVRITQVLP